MIGPQKFVEEKNVEHFIHFQRQLEELCDNNDRLITDLQIE